MSKYDPEDGYEECSQCGRLTKDLERLCGICRGDIIPQYPKSRRRGGRKPSYYQPGNPTRRKYNHSFD